MVFIATMKAELLSTFAFHHIHCKIRIFLKKFVTIRIRTPFDILVVVRKLFAVPIHVFLVVVIPIFIFVLDMFKIKRMRDDYVTTKLHTFSKNATNSFRFNFIFKKIGPGTCTELVTANQLFSLHLFIILFKVAV